MAGLVNLVGLVNLINSDMAGFDGSARLVQIHHKVLVGQFLVGHLVDVVVRFDAPPQQAGVVDAVGVVWQTDLLGKIAKVVPAHAARQSSVDTVQHALDVGLPRLVALFVVRRVQIVERKVDERPVNAAPHIGSHSLQTSALGCFVRVAR